MGAAAGGIIGGVASGIATGYAANKQAKAAEYAARQQAEASGYSADVQNKISARELAAQQALTGYTSAQQQQLADAYRSAYQGTSADYKTGESNLAELFAKSPEELETLKKQALRGESEGLQEGTSALNAALAQQGVRGGQAATQLRRGIGETTTGATENIQNLMANEAINRAAEKRQYTEQQQQAKQQFMLSPESAQYSQQTNSAQSANLQNLLNKYLAVK